MSNTNVRVFRAPFPTPLPKQEEMDSLKDVDAKRARLEKWNRDLKHFDNAKWDIIVAAKVPNDVLALNAVAKKDVDGKEFYPNLRYRPDCRSVRLKTPVDGRCGEMWAIALPQYLIGTDFEKKAITLPSEVEEGNLYKFEMVPCIVLQRQGSIKNPVVDITTVNFTVPEKKPYRAGQNSQDSALIAGGVLPKDEPTHIGVDG